MTTRLSTLEAGRIRERLHDCGYRTQPRAHVLAYEVEAGGDQYLLVWLPRPVEAWALLPHRDTPSYQQICALVQEVLNEKTP